LLKGFFGSSGPSSGLTHTRIGSGGDARGTGGERSPDIDERGRVFRETARSYDFWVDNGLALIGSPETVVHLLKDQQQRVGYDVFLAQHQIATMPLEQVTTSLELFGKEVMPAFT
jgi:alkanesulfonate monooxygenase SsuD/methylene tetrahydromethanopterin reductase-like flavin-dependent oxidoreductase (luciferase family)